MILTFDKSLFVTNPVMRYLAYAVLALFLSVIHIVFLRFIAVSSVTPDLLFILTVWIALVEGQFAGIIAGFLCGLLFDVVSTDVQGSNALAKTLAGFVAGFFYKEGFAMTIIGNARFLMICALAGLIHNVVYYFLYTRPMETGFLMFFLKYGVATTLYTTVAAVFPMLIVNRQKDW